MKPPNHVNAAAVLGPSRSEIAAARFGDFNPYRCLDAERERAYCAPCNDETTAES